MSTIDEILRLRADKQRVLDENLSFIETLKKSIEAYDIVLKDLNGSVKNKIEKETFTFTFPEVSQVIKEPRQQRIRRLPANEIENARLIFEDTTSILTINMFEKLYSKEFPKPSTANYKIFLRRLVNNRVLNAIVFDGNYYFAPVKWFNEEDVLDSKYIPSDFNKDVSEVIIEKFFERTS